MPFFSVVLPVYNKEKYVQQTLQSVLQQRFEDYEIIVVNDGSTDDSGQIVQQYNDDRLRYFFQENAGVSAARNLGIQKALGQFIAFIDADDLWKPNHLQELKTLIDCFPQAGIYASRYQLIFKNQSVYVPQFKNIPSEYSGVVVDYFESSLHYAIATSSSVVVSKQVLEEVGLFDTRISVGEDNDLWIRIAVYYPVVIGSKITASYVHYIEDSLSKTPILQKKVKDFSFYKADEMRIPSLKKYLDLYRMEYALQYKMVNRPELAGALYKDIHPDNIRLKSKILFYLPPFILIGLKKIKILLRNNGIDFSIYQ